MLTWVPFKHRSKGDFSLFDAQGREMPSSLVEGTIGADHCPAAVGIEVASMLREVGAVRPGDTSAAPNSPAEKAGDMRY
jgi:hypothetical protein